MGSSARNLVQAFRRLRSIFAHNFVPKTLLYSLKMTVENMLAAREIKKEKGIALKENAAAPLAANIKMEKGVSVKREPVFGPGGLLRIKREVMGMAPMMNIKREMIKGEPLDVKPQITPMHQTTPMHRPMGVTPKLEPGTVQESRVTEVLKRHFKGEPGVAEKGADDPFNLKKTRSAPAPPPAPAPEKKFKCHRCSYAATKIASLDNHVRYVHMKEPKPFRCPYNDNCRYSAMSNGSIVSHVNRVHLKVKRFKCTVPGCSYAGVFQRNLNLHTRNAHPELAPSPVKRPRKMLKHESRRVKNEAADSASESDDDIEILSATISDSMITLTDEETHNKSVDCSETLEDSGINLSLTEADRSSEVTEADQESREGEKAKKTAAEDAEFIRSLIESAFWFSVERRDDKNKETDEATKNDEDEIVCVSDANSDIITVPDEDEVQLIISDDIEAEREVSNASMVRSIIEDILKNVVGEGVAPPNTTTENRTAPISPPVVETIGVESGVESIGVECIGGGETIGIDEDDIVALDIADAEPLEVLAEVSHNEIWRLPEIIM